jgi:hypothetical protein
MWRLWIGFNSARGFQWLVLPAVVSGRPKDHLSQMLAGVRGKNVGISHKELPHYVSHSATRSVSCEFDLWK